MIARIFNYLSMLGISLSLTGCAAATMATYSGEGFIADHKGSKGNSYKGCEIWNTCGEVSPSDLWGTDEGSVWGNEGGSIYGSDGDSSDVYGDSKGMYGRSNPGDTHMDSGTDAGSD